MTDFGEHIEHLDQIAEAAVQAARKWAALTDVERGNIMLKVGTDFGVAMWNLYQRCFITMPVHTDPAGRELRLSENEQIAGHILPHSQR